jgi:acyl-CoA synthetase (AMP-forming)/AMP-acid ligase II
MDPPVLCRGAAARAPHRPGPARPRPVAERPLVILSGNDLEHFQLALGAMYAGIPYAPLSPAYSLVATDPAKLAT